jgi:hypothetical protein
MFDWLLEIEKERNGIKKKKGSSSTRSRVEKGLKDQFVKRRRRQHGSSATSFSCEWF